jgi:hypothetical protein
MIERTWVINGPKFRHVTITSALANDPADWFVYAVDTSREVAVLGGEVLPGQPIGVLVMEEHFPIQLQIRVRGGGDGVFVVKKQEGVAVA